MHAVELSNLSRCDGSAILASGETVVQAAVHGPTEIKISKELYDKALLEVSFKPKVGQTDCAERLMECFIRNAVEPIVLTALHPRTSVNITIQEIQDDGNMLACSINGACLALLDAGVPMSGVVAAVCVGIFEDKILPFPSLKDVKNAKCVATICITDPGKNMVGMRTSTFVSTEELKKCIEIAKTTAEDLFRFYRDCMQKRYQKAV